MAAAHTNFKGFALSSEESEKLAPMADHCLAKYLPMMGPYGVEMMLAASIATLGFTKYMAYQAHLAEQRKEASRVQRMGG